MGRDRNVTVATAKIGIRFGLFAVSLKKRLVFIGGREVDS